MWAIGAATLLLVGAEGQSAYVYANDFYKLLAFRDIRIAVYKAFVFGIIIALVGCWRGYRAQGGAEGGGQRSHQQRGDQQPLDPHRGLFPHQAAPRLMGNISMEPVIDVVNLSKAFGPKVVLSNVNLQVQEGESLCVMGGSGTGKTVLLRNIMGLLTPDAGHVAVEGKIIQQLDREELFEVRKKIGMCFQMGGPI